MLRRYKNGFIDVIQKHGFSPSSFRVEKTVDGNPAFILQLRNTPRSFMARTSSEDFHSLDMRFVRFAPDYPTTDYYPDTNWTNIEDIYERFGLWLDNDVALYLEEVDGLPARHAERIQANARENETVMASEALLERLNRLLDTCGVEAVAMEPEPAGDFDDVIPF